MKNAIVFGCGAKNGISIIDALLAHNYTVTNIGASILNKKNVTNIPIEWKKIDIPFIHKTFNKITENIDFVFFNQDVGSYSRFAYIFEEAFYFFLMIWVHFY
jgi:hypothetical protein